MDSTFTFLASEMSTPLGDAVTVNPDERGEDARERLRGYGFDQAPATEEGRVLGWVRTSHLGGRGPVRSSLQPLDRTVVLSAASPVGDVVAPVATEGFIFLADSSGISSFIVPSDLDRHVVRSYLYVVLAEIELLLAGLVKRSVEPERVVESFQNRERQRFDAARLKGRETHPVEYLHLSDYRKLIPGVTPLQKLRSWTLDDQRRDLKDLVELRTCVAHPAKSLIGEMEPGDVASRTALAAEVLGRLRELNALGG